MASVSPSSVCRFAPSPNGPLHLGHAYSALRNIAVADRIGARLLLRMENIDLARCSAEKEAAVIEDLTWLGFAWSGPVRRQSDHFGLYDEAIAALATRDLVYPCFCTRGDIHRAVRHRADWPRDPDGAPLYPGTCRRLSASRRERRRAEGVPFALRLAMDSAMTSMGGKLDWEEFDEGTTARRVMADPASWGDAVLRRKDVPASYHVAVVVDDALQGATDIVRGQDLFAATALHRLLQALLDLPAPRYHHHRLILSPQGEKLSKSRDAPGLADLRASGLSPTDVVTLIDDHVAVATPARSAVPRSGVVVRKS